MLTYDDLPNEEDGEGSSLPYGSSTLSFPKMSRQGATENGLPVVGMVEPAKTQQETVAIEEAKKPAKVIKELTEEEKMQLVASDEFLRFFNRATRIVERALFQNETPDIFIDYTGVKGDMERYVFEIKKVFKIFNFECLLF